ncbi:MAG: FAD-binding protein, partial [Anaerolineales bacterium]
APKIGYAYAEDYLKLRPDVAVKGQTLSQVAEKRGVPVEALQRSIEKSNRAKEESGLPQLEGGPWLLLGPAKAYFTTTEGGAVIDKQFRVHSEDGKPITGLYAVGQTGLGGQILWGHGLHIAWAMTSGRLVGENLAKESK